MLDPSKFPKAKQPKVEKEKFPLQPVITLKARKGKGTKSLIQFNSQAMTHLCLGPNTEKNVAVIVNYGVDSNDPTNIVIGTIENSVDKIPGSIFYRTYRPMSNLNFNTSKGASKQIYDIIVRYFNLDDSRDNDLFMKGEIDTCCFELTRQLTTKIEDSTQTEDINNSSEDIVSQQKNDSLYEKAMAKVQSATATHQNNIKFEQV